MAHTGLRDLRRHLDKMTLCGARCGEVAETREPRGVDSPFGTVDWSVSSAAERRRTAAFTKCDAFVGIRTHRSVLSISIAPK